MRTCVCVCVCVCVRACVRARVILTWYFRLVGYMPIHDILMASRLSVHEGAEKTSTISRNGSSPHDSSSKDSDRVLCRSTWNMSRARISLLALTWPLAIFKEWEEDMIKHAPNNVPTAKDSDKRSR